MPIRNKENLDQLSLPFAPLYYAYGMSLLNHSIQQASFLGDAVPETKNILMEEPENSLEESPIETDAHSTTDLASAEPCIPMDIEQRSGAMVEKTMELIDDLQVAWEVLDMARVIYEKAIQEGSGLETTALSLKLANVYIALGDVSMESDAFVSATEDFKKALTLRQTHLPADDRSIPEIFFKIGVAFEMAEKYAEAKSNIEEALSILKARNIYLKKLLDAPSSQGKDTVVDLEKTKEEIADLEALFPDLEAKVP